MVFDFARRSPLSSTGEGALDALPSVRPSHELAITVDTAVPADAQVLGILVGPEGEVPADLGIDREGLGSIGFTGALGSASAVPGAGGRRLVAVGVGDPTALDATSLRNAAAAFARAAGGATRLALSLAGAAQVTDEAAGQAAVEGVVLARYHYDPFKRDRAPDLASLGLITDASRLDAVRTGTERGRIMAAAAALARDLANTPGSFLTAAKMAEVATALGARQGFAVKVFDKDALIELGCGGLLGVNAGSTEPPRMIKLRYEPASGTATGHIAMVGKGIMYDSGGISLKPSDAMHAAMKSDMSGAAAILAAISALRELGCPVAVTGYLMCTDNMPSGSAMKLGDVLTIHGGMTVEVANTDAEGRLVMADALVMAAEEEPDAIVDIATLTGAALRALGTEIAVVLGNDQPLVDRVIRAGERTDEPVWQLPLERRYRPQLYSALADIKNMGGENAGAITAALFLDEFTNGVPWAHIDIAGTMKADADTAWRSIGATGFGTRLLIDLALEFGGTPS